MLETLVYNNFILRYQIIGTGKKAILAFHGAGSNVYQFNELLQQLPEYTCYSIALFGHESEISAPSTVLLQQDWNKLLQLFLNKHQITTFSVMAFSIGNRPLTFTLNGFYAQIQQAILFAPDNVVVNNWYKLATQTLLGKLLFRYVTSKHQILLYFLHIINNFYDKNTVRHWKKIIKNPLHLQSIRKTWLAYYQANFSILSTECLQTTNLIFVLGNKDRVVSTSAIIKEVNYIKKCRIVLLSAHHYNLLQQFVRLKEFSIFE